MRLMLELLKLSLRMTSSKKDTMDSFLMATSGPLGKLQFLRIWHDNSGVGPNASWFLGFIVFRDIQTGIKYDFIVNDWLAVEKSDYQLERLVTVAGAVQKKKFRHLFINTSSKVMADYHLWVSLFTRPPRSRFTRCQRVACCFLMLFLSMLVSAMWYGVIPEKTGQGGLNVGPFSLSEEQMGVGFISDIIVFFPVLLIVLMFRRSRPRQLRRSRIEVALEKARESSKNRDLTDDDLNYGLVKEGFHKVEAPVDTPIYDHENAPQKRKRKSAKIMLPWWCCYITWSLVFVLILLSILLTLSYGITFGQSKSTKWITTMLLSFVSSMLFIQPIQVFLFSLVVSTLFKKGDLDDEDVDEDERDPVLANDELWLLQDGDPQLQRGEKFDDHDLLDLKSERVKEVDMWEMIVELVGYCCFIWILFVLSYGNRDPNAWYLMKSLRNGFLHEGSLDGTDYTKITNADQFWRYLNTGLMPDLRADVNYNGKPPYQLKGFFNDYANRIMGYATIRQIRAKPNICGIPYSMTNVTKRCSGYTIISNEETEDFCGDWVKPGPKNRFEYPCTHLKEFKYRTAEELKALTILGDRDWYSGGGYVIELKPSTKDILKRLKLMQEYHWIDHMTRAVFIEFASYNTQVNLFGISTMIAEFTPGGGVYPKFRFEGIRLIKSADGFGIFLYGCEVAFVCFTVFFTLRELHQMYKLKWSYWKNYWSYCEWSMIIASYSLVLVYFWRMIEVNKTLDIFQKTHGNGYIRMTYAVTMAEYFEYVMGALSFTGTLKFIKLLRFNKRMGMLSATLKQCWDDLSGFLMAFFLCFFSFVIMFHLLLGTRLEDFANFTICIETSFSMMLGKFKFNEMKNVSMLVPPMFFVFVLCNSWVLINLLLTLIIKSFEQVKNEMNNNAGEYNMVNFVWGSFKEMIGKAEISKKNSKKEKNKEENSNKGVEQLPNKVDQFLEYINDTYFNGNMDIDKSILRTAIKPQRNIINSNSDTGINSFF